MFLQVRLGGGGYNRAVVDLQTPVRAKMGTDPIFRNDNDAENGRQSPFSLSPSPRPTPYALRLTLFVFLLLTAPLLADTVVLNDGRTFTGVVKSDGDNVLVQMAGGTLSFRRDQVARIEQKATPEEEFAAKLADAPSDDVAALFTLVQWAATNGLEKQAMDVAGRIVAISPDHAGARKMLGQIKLEGQWLSFTKSAEIVRGKLDAGQHDCLLKEILPALETIAVTKDKQQVVRELQGLALLRTKDFAGAAKAFAASAELAEPPAAVRLAAQVEILKENADGMYVLTEGYPPAAAVLSDDPPALKPGPASLADPLVLQAALRERAKKEIEAGRKLMDAAQKVEATDPESAKPKYAQAAACFDKADALTENIARSYRIEIARRRIAVIRRDADADAEKFDKAMSKLGKANLSPQEYQNLLLNLIRLLDNVRDNLNLVVTAAKPYTKELVLELKWAELDLKKLDGMRKILLDELNGAK